MKRATSHQSSLSIHMAKAAPTLGSALTPAQYRTRKVALITGQSPSLSRAVGRSKRTALNLDDRRNYGPGWFLPHRTSPREGLRGTRTVRPSSEPRRAIPHHFLRRIRRSSSFNTGRIEHLYKDVHERTYHLAEPQLPYSRPSLHRSQYDFALWRSVLRPLLHTLHSH